MFKILFSTLATCMKLFLLLFLITFFRNGIFTLVNNWMFSNVWSHSFILSRIFFRSLARSSCTYMHRLFGLYGLDPFLYRKNVHIIWLSSLKINLSNGLFAWCTLFAQQYSAHSQHKLFLNWCILHANHDACHFKRTKNERITAVILCISLVPWLCFF